MILSHKTQILWFTSYKLQYACRWSSWHYNHHQVKRIIFLLGMVKKKAFCLLGEGRALILNEFCVVPLTLRVGNKATRGFCRTIQPKIASFLFLERLPGMLHDSKGSEIWDIGHELSGVSSKNPFKILQALVTRVFPSLLTPLPNKNPKPGSPSCLAARRLQKTNL